MGQKKKPLPSYVLERVHELRIDFGRSERKAVEEACEQFHRQLGGGKPFSRVRNAYRGEFKGQIGDRSIKEFRIWRATQELAEKETAELVQLRVRLADREREAPEILGTNDLSEESLQSFIAAWHSRESKEQKDVVERSEHEVPMAYRKKYGHLPSGAEIAHLLDAVATAKERAYLAIEIRGLRSQIANFEQEKANDYF